MTQHTTWAAVFPDTGLPPAPCPIRGEAHPEVPPMTPNYEFRNELMGLVFDWIMGKATPGLLLTGPTGSGKSSLVQEVAARLNRPVFLVPCHGRLEYPDLIGEWVFKKTETGIEQVFVEKELPLAMESGGILILDEVNFLDPDQIGGLNRITDKGTLFIPQIGKTIKAHPDFRVAVTGNGINGIGNYKGTTKQNVAFLGRYRGGYVPYLSPLAEAKVLHSQYPTIPPDLLDGLVRTANALRKQHDEGELSRPLGGRTMHMWAESIAFRGRLIKESKVLAKDVYNCFLLTDGGHWPPEEQEAVLNVLKATL